MHANAATQLCRRRIYHVRACVRAWSVRTYTTCSARSYQYQPLNNTTYLSFSNRLPCPPQPFRPLPAIYLAPYASVAVVLSFGIWQPTAEDDGEMYVTYSGVRVLWGAMSASSARRWLCHFLKLADWAVPLYCSLLLAVRSQRHSIFEFVLMCAISIYDVIATKVLVR